MLTYLKARYTKKKIVLVQVLKQRICIGASIEIIENSQFWAYMLPIA